MLHFALGVPVVVCADRVLAAIHLLADNPDVNVLVADDALQHYALMRDVEVEVISAERRYGNNLLVTGGASARAARTRAQLRVAHHAIMDDAELPATGTATIMWRGAN